MIKKIFTISILALVINANAQIINTIVGNGTAAYAGDGGQATVAELNQPVGIAFDAIGNLYIGDVSNNRIRKITTAGVISTFAGNGTGAGTTTCTTCFSGDGGAATAAELYLPSGTTFDASGNLYIADSYNNRIRKINTAGIITTIAGSGATGVGMGGYSGDGGQATAAELNQPISIAFDAVGNLYIGDLSNNRIRKVNTAGIISTFAGNGTGGFSGDGAQATAAEIYNPIGLAVDAASNLYIADNANNRIRKVNTAGIITTVAGYTSTAGYSGDGGQATAAALAAPLGIAFDVVGNLYIADAGNDRIRMVNTTGIIATIAGNGTGAYSGDGGQGTAAELKTPFEVAVDALGNLFIADYANNRIRMVSVPTVTVTPSVSSFTICSGTTATLTASGASTYSWSTNATTSSISVTPTITTTYSVLATNTFIIFNTPAVSVGPVATSVVTVTNCTSGLEQVTNSNDVNIYPNPTKGMLNVELSMLQENTTLQITDMLGNTVKQIKVQNSQFTIDATELNEGIYNISISSNEGTINKRIVIVK